MRLHRFIYNFDNKGPYIIVDDKILINQIRNVLKLKISEHTIFILEAGTEVEAELTKINNNYLEFHLIRKLNNKSEPVIKVTLYCSILKRENFEYVAQKVTEIGINEIVPIITERTIKLNLRADRINKIIKEAVEQSGRSTIPNFRNVIKFNEAIQEESKKHNLNILFDFNGESIVFNKLKSLLKNKLISVGIFIGPEGGWSPAEISLAKKSGFKILSLGKTTLRAETAAIIASYITVNLK